MHLIKLNKYKSCQINSSSLQASSTQPRIRIQLLTGQSILKALEKEGIITLSLPLHRLPFPRQAAQARVIRDIAPFTPVKEGRLLVAIAILPEAKTPGLG